MCGIFGYSGNKTNAGEIVVDGLKRLDYRGYDSWGVAVSADKKITVRKKAGKISDVGSLDLPTSLVAIAHTRWATTGAVTDTNAHPHLATDGSFALAQNGIVENFAELKADLIGKGYAFLSETDTEVIVRLIEANRRQAPDLVSAVRSAFLALSGRNTIILLTAEGEIIAARNGSPLVIGKNSKTGETFLSSDVLSFADRATEMMVIDNGRLVVVTPNNVQVTDIKTETSIPIQFVPIGFSSAKVDKGDFPHFMLKEIHEAPAVLRTLANQDPGHYDRFADGLKKARTIYTIGSGGAGVAAAQVAFYLRAIGKIKAVSLVGADAVEYQDLFTPDDLLLAISQSGETADVLEVLEPAKKKGVTIASFVNMPGSMITRLSDYAFMSESGPEICVMSTKTFDAQVAFGYLLAKTIQGQGDDARQKLRELSQTIDRYLLDQSIQSHLRTLGISLSHHHDIFLLGKYQNFQIIREGMVKIIEASYRHGHALPAGDLKHYVITLMQSGVAVLVIISNDQTKAEVINAVNEVKLRGATVFGIAPSDEANFDAYIPVPDTGETAAIMNLIPLQLLAYHMAVALGNNVDKPRNIAKSVTVK